LSQALLVLERLDFAIRDYLTHPVCRSCA